MPETVETLRASGELENIKIKVGFSLSLEGVIDGQVLPATDLKGCYEVDLEVESLQIGAEQLSKTTILAMCRGAKRGLREILSDPE